MRINKMALQHMIYDLLKCQIKFGVHRFGEPLPTIKEASGYFLVSVDTIRLAYLQLKREGYISLNTGIGATVKVRYSDGEIRQFIQEFFSCRRTALYDLAQAALPLLSFALLVSLKNAGPQRLKQVEHFCLNQKTQPPYKMAQQFLLIYSVLGNDLYMRLIWQMMSFFQAPFLSIPRNKDYFDAAAPLLDMIRLCRQRDWNALRLAVEAFHQRFISAMRQFYDENISPECNGEQVGFSWNIYKKSSQICYSLGLELLRGIRRGDYPEGSLLPAPKKLADEKQVSLNTVRRTIALLNKIGATRSVNGIGTKVLPPSESPENSDISDAAIQKRLLDFIQSLQILTLTCRGSFQAMAASIEKSAVAEWLEPLKAVKRGGRYEIMVYTCFELIASHAPCQAVRMIYSELVQQLFWGYPLRDLHGERESVNAFYLPYLDALIDCLVRSDITAFSEKLEELIMIDTASSVRYLLNLGMPEAASVLIPEPISK